jgi:hypothetical protein
MPTNVFYENLVVRDNIFLVKSIIFWDIMRCSLLSFNRRFEGTYRLHLQGRISRFRKPASKQVLLAKTSVETQRTIRRYIPEDDTLHNHRCENLKSYMIFVVFFYISTVTLWFINDAVSRSCQKIG